ncbi:hypothetical protein BJ508DRAFT_339720 [Ascobolus immersus RN42]|uniref:F-box domain-containing protein n=1 Tax=Ascobolus immersus RN42 TaxID=1160509 RepID=A0A3N4HRS9_ASCIM|nr:hypothetical protein BJ508DRAFT_339720 [Ascobolus immersus RN42]
MSLWTRASFTTLPYEIHLLILTHVPSYDALINYISASHHLERILLSYPLTVFRALLNTELALFPPTKTAGRSLLIHALQQIHISHLAARPCPCKTCKPNQCRWKQQVHTLFTTTLHLRRGNAQDELTFWLSRVSSLPSSLPSSPLPPSIWAEMVDLHLTAIELAQTFTASSLPTITAHRLTSTRNTHLTTNPFTLIRGAPLAAILTASDLPISTTESTRILQAIYGLRLAIDLIRLGHAAGITIARLREVVWSAYDTLWQLEALVTVYAWLKASCNVMAIHGRPKREELKCVRHYRRRCTRFPADGQPSYDPTEALRSAHVDNIVFAEGLGGIWATGAAKRAGVARFSWGGWACEGVCVLREGLPEVGVLRKVLLPYEEGRGDDVIFGDGGGLEDYRFAWGVSAPWHGLRRVEGGVEAVERYVPVVRIADGRWAGFREGERCWEGGRLRVAWWVGERFDRRRGRREEKEVLRELAVWDDARLEGWGLLWPNNEGVRVGRI